MANSTLRNSIARLSKKYPPDDILHELSVIYEEYSVGSDSEAEVDFWLKCSRATANLSSGAEKWIGEMKDEQEDEE